MSTVYAPSCQDCGWVGKRVRSPAVADYSLRQHSCAKALRAAAAADRGRAADVAVDRTPKPCRHKRTTHVHGTHACYVLDACRCRPCSAANTAYETHRVRQTAYGRWHPYVDAAPIRAHLLTLGAAGVGLKQVTRLTGISGGVLCKLVYGQGGKPPSRQVREATAAKILTVTPGHLAAGARVPVIGTARRLQALVAAGWGCGTLADRLEIDVTNLTPLLHGRRATTLATHERVKALYAELEDTPGPSLRSRRRAAAEGWAPPIAWDDDTIEDADAHPAHQMVTDERGVDEAAVERRLAGERIPLNRAERWVVVRRLHAQGLSDGQIARRAGLVDRQVLRDRQSLGLPAVTAERRSA